MTPPSEPSQPTLWTEEPELRVGPVARVAMLAAVDDLYTFSIPDELVGMVEPGRRLRVPFGRSGRPAPAFCVAIAREPWTSTLRPVIEVLDDQRLLSDSLLELGQWIARYYCCPLGRTLGAMVPEPIRRQSGFQTLRLVSLKNKAGSEDEPRRPSAKRQMVIDYLLANPSGITIKTLCEKTGVGSSLVTTMAKDGWIEITTQREPAPAPNFDKPGQEPPFDLSRTQRAAIDRITTLARENTFRAVLLFGVSGSGKTEVYIHSIRSVLAMGRQAILLVPEIALTTQIVDRLVSRFQDVAVIHSGLTDVQRSLTWSAIARGRKRVVIGTRSAIFAPCPDLGIIIVDEEQEGSYKNQQSPRFHTREVAIKRAQLASVPVVLGSATPSLETWHNCDRLAHFERITLPSRIAGLPMPTVELVDMNLAGRERRGIHLMSMCMESRLHETLAAGQQAVILLNRRGYATYLVCARCRYAIVCPQCRVNMVFHQTTGKAVCHYCQTRIVVPTRCANPSCNGTLIRWGMGTQRVEEEINTKFPAARVARADSDNMTRISQYEKVIRDFADHNTDILIGTQMIAKGLDFPSVAFVGVINADTSLAIPDFRAAERTFQLVTQVAGRAGRVEAGGRVVVQTYMPRAVALQCAMRHDYESFAAHELAIRRKFCLPPFSRLARVIVSRPSQLQAIAETEAMAGQIRDFFTRNGIQAEVMGPQSAPIARIKNLYRYELLIQAANANQLMEACSRLRGDKSINLRARHVLMDVDPVALL